MVRIIGAACLLAGCGSFGFAMAAASRREERELGRLLRALEYMSCELSYRMTPLPGLCREAAKDAGGVVGAFFLELARELERQAAPDAGDCVRAVLRESGVSGVLRRQLEGLSSILGRFDLPGQLRGLESAIHACGEALRTVRTGAPERRRSYQTLGLCAGAALAILLL